MRDMEKEEIPRKIDMLLVELKVNDFFFKSITFLRQQLHPPANQIEII